MFENFVEKNIHRLVPYPPGKPSKELSRELHIDKVIKLASNENPLGPSPKALQAILKGLNEIHEYPEGSCYYVRDRLFSTLNKKYDFLTKDHLLFGNGTCELIELMVRTFTRAPDHILTSEKAFIIYKLVGEAHGCHVDLVPLKNFTFDLKAFKKKVSDQTKLIFIANPNNPTGTHVNEAELLSFLKAMAQKKVLIVLDEAYYEYARGKDYPDGISLLDQFKNLVILRTFSKIYGLAGLRIGYAVAHPEIIHYMNKVRAPFNVNSMAQRAACAALDDNDFVEKSLKTNREGQEYLYDQFKKMGIFYLPSSTNFVFIDTEKDSLQIYQQLLREGVIIRPLLGYGLKTHFRVTVGTPLENEFFIHALEKVLCLS